MVLADSFTGTDLAMVVTIVVLLLISTYLAVAETALTRMTKAKAQALAEDNRRSGPKLLGLVTHPERFLNPVLLVVLVCQLVQATLTGIVADRLFGAIGIAVATFFNVVIVFVLCEAAPKTWAIQNPERAALVSAGGVSALTAFWPLRMLSQALDRSHQLDPAGQGLEGRPVRVRGGAAGAGRCRRRRGGARRRRTRVDRADHRVRRHGRPRGHGAAPRHDRCLRRLPGRRRDGGRVAQRLQPAAGVRRQHRRHHRAGVRQGPHAGRARRSERRATWRRWCGRRTSSPRRSAPPSCCPRCRRSTSTWPSSSTSTGAPPASSPSRT